MTPAWAGPSSTDKNGLPGQRGAEVGQTICHVMLWYIFSTLLSMRLLEIRGQGPGIPQ